MSLIKCLFFAVLLIPLTTCLDEEAIRAFIANVPADGDTEFLKYALTLGYQKSNGKIYINGMRIPSIFEGIYQLYMLYATPVLETESVNGNIICFPTGCIDINDPGIHP